MNFIQKILILLSGVAISVQAVPPVLNYAGQVAVNGEAFDGNGLFKFALVNADGTTTYWSNDGTSVNGSQPQASVSVPVIGGLYSILLGNTAQQGMGAIDPAVFAQHTDAKLRVWFSDGVNGFQQLSPDRPFASVPYAFSAGTAQTAGSAPIANGAVKLDMLSQDVKTQINAPSVGSLLAVPSGSDAPAGYSLYQQGEPKELVWEEKAPVSEARYAYDGVEVLDGKIYFVGGQDGSSSKNIAERYDPVTNTWETLSPMSVARKGVASSVLNGKLYAIGGVGLSSVEVFDPNTGNWIVGVALPSEVDQGAAITVNGKIYLIGGRNASGQRINQVLCLDPSSNQWTAMANMPTARTGHKLVWFENRIWAIGGNDGSYSKKVESYDPNSDSWRIEVSLSAVRHWPVAWVSSGKIYAGGGYGSSHLQFEVYDPTTRRWANAGNFPEKKFAADAVVLNNKVYVIAGDNGSSHSNKVFAADLNASVEGVYDLYRKDGDAPVGTPVVQSVVADGSITTDKLNEQILKYLKPEITSQPQAQTVYADTNVSFSVSAEGKYLTYQWKKDGVDLAGETNATLNITDANATLHDGNYSVVVSNDFGSVESDLTEILVKDAILNGLIAWYPLDQNASDLSGNGNHGTPQNTPQYVTQDDKSFVKFEANSDADASGDHILLPYTSFSSLTEITISGWINFSTSSHSSGHAASIISFGDSKLGQIYIGAKDMEGLSYLSSNNSVNRFLLRGIKNNWVHFVLTGTQQSTAGYINGQIVDSGQALVSYSGGNAAFGREWWDNGGNTSTRLNGSLDEIRIYDRALSAEEVQVLYNLGQ